MPMRDWRTTDEEGDAFGLRELAWEFLRRNPEFQAEMRELGDDPPDDHPALARWGLRFRR